MPNLLIKISCCHRSAGKSQTKEQTEDLSPKKPKKKAKKKIKSTPSADTKGIAPEVEKAVADEHKPDSDKPDSVPQKVDGPTATDDSKKQAVVTVLEKIGEDKSKKKSEVAADNKENIAKEQPNEAPEPEDLPPGDLFACQFVY